jgi:hypothetical protein
MTQPVTWEVKSLLVGVLVLVIAIPFGRREDWIGWLALFAVLACAMGMWALLIRGIVFHTPQWWRRRGERD